MRSGTESKTPILLQSKVLLYLNGSPVTDKYLSKVRETMMLSQFKKYMKDKHKWTKRTETELDWDLLKTCMKITQELEEMI